LKIIEEIARWNQAGRAGARLLIARPREPD
jgi:hypothetical protein